jgi:hypothetical protein
MPPDRRAPRGAGGLSPPSRQAIFHDTARRVYRL